MAHRVADLVADHLEGIRDLPPLRPGTRDALDAVLERAAARGAGRSRRRDRHRGRRRARPHAAGRPPALPRPRAVAVVAGRAAGRRARVGLQRDRHVVGGRRRARRRSSWSSATGWRSCWACRRAPRGCCCRAGRCRSLTAFAAARLARLGGHDPDATVYCSTQTHASLPRALRALGFAADRVRVLPTDAAFRLPADAVAQAVAADRAAGLRPFLLVANAGTTNTGAVDPLPALADLAAAEELWLHVDGAYGAPGALVPQGAALLDGIGRADSLGRRPAQVAVRAVRVRGAAGARAGRCWRARSRCRPSTSPRRRAPAPSLRDRSPAADAHHPRAEAVADDQDVRAAGDPRRDRAAASRWPSTLRRRCAPAGVGGRHARAAGRRDVRAPRGEPAALAAALLADGYAVVSSTMLDGRPVLRLCTINPRTTEAELDEVIARLDALRRAGRV